MKKMLQTGLSLMVVFVLTASAVGAEKGPKVILKEGMATKYDPTKKVEIKTRSGKVYKDAEIINANQFGIDIAFQNDKGTVLKHLPFSELNKSVQKHFGYNPKKAEKEMNKLHAMWKKRQQEKVFKSKHQREMRKVINRPDVQKQAGNSTLKKTERILDRNISRRGHKVMLKIIRDEGPGVIAWADSPDATVTTGHYGKVFIWGLRAPQGNMWVGNIYPTGIQYAGYECYAPNVDMAIGVANSHIGEILKGAKKARNPVR